MASQSGKTYLQTDPPHPKLVPLKNEGFIQTSGINQPPRFTPRGKAIGWMRNSAVAGCVIDEEGEELCPKKLKNGFFMAIFMDSVVNRTIKAVFVFWDDASILFIGSLDSKDTLGDVSSHKSFRQTFK